MEPFVWGPGGRKLSAGDVAQYRKLSEALRGSAENPKTFWEGMQNLTGKVGGTLLDTYANRAEDEQRSALAELLASGDYEGVLGSEWASPEQSALASAMMQRGWQLDDRESDRAYNAPMRDMQLRQLGLQVDALENPPYEPPDLKTIFDPESGREQKGFFTEGNEFNPVGGNAAPDDPLVSVNTGDAYTPGWKKIDEGFADTYLNWTAGGSADTKAQLQNLDNAIGLIEGGQTGVGNAVSALPKEIRAFVDTNGLIAQENVEEVVQRSLRETLGAQFTEREGERLIQRAFNPLLPPEENARRIRLLIGKISEMAQAKDEMAEYFRANGTLQGYEGPAPSMSALTTVEREFGTDPEPGDPANVRDEEIDWNADTPPEGWGGDVELWQFMPPEDRKLWQN